MSPLRAQHKRRREEAAFAELDHEIVPFVAKKVASFGHDRLTRNVGAAISRELLARPLVKSIATIKKRDYGSGV